MIHSGVSYFGTQFLLEVSLQPWLPLWAEVSVWPHVLALWCCFKSTPSSPYWCCLGTGQTSQTGQPGLWCWWGSIYRAKNFPGRVLGVLVVVVCSCLWRLIPLRDVVWFPASGVGVIAFARAPPAWEEEPHDQQGERVSPSLGSPGETPLAGFPGRRWLMVSGRSVLAHL